MELYAIVISTCTESQEVLIATIQCNTQPSMWLERLFGVVEGNRSKRADCNDAFDVSSLKDLVSKVGVHKRSKEPLRRRSPALSRQESCVESQTGKTDGDIGKVRLALNNRVKMH